MSSQIRNGKRLDNSLQKKFIERLGSLVLLRDLEDIELEGTPLYDLFDDDKQQMETFQLLQKEVEWSSRPIPWCGTPDTKMKKDGQKLQVACKCDAEVNVMDG